MYFRLECAVSDVKKCREKIVEMVASGVHPRLIDIQKEKLARLVRKESVARQSFNVRSNHAVPVFVIS